MILGYILVYFCLAATVVGMLAYLPGMKNEGAARLRIARWSVYAACIGLLATTAYLWQLIITHQFQVSYVFRYSSLDMPFKYIVSSFWGGQEGTFLLWATYGGLLSVFLRFKARQYEAPVNFFYMGITLFLLLTLVKRSPFALMPNIPPDGNGLNPLLQDPWMTIHPPIMFVGFASLGIPAAFAMAALVRKDWDNWIPRSMPWTLLGVLTLGTGLTLGGYWSYSILGWGGYWGWDPVENSSLVPWLFSITLLHSQLIQLKRGLFKRANLILAMLPFIFLTYSTFLTRSGVLADFSVHSFTDLGINGFLVAFMVIFLGGGLALYIWRFRSIPVDKDAAPLMSREYFMFLGALSFALFGIFVCLGTSAPLISRLWDTPSNIEPEFYNRIGLPFTILICTLIGITPYLTFNRGEITKQSKRLLIPFLLTLVSAPLFYWGGIRYWPYLLMMVAGFFALCANAIVAAQIMSKKWEAAGGYVAHVGIGFLVLGVLTSTAYDQSFLVELRKDHPVSAFGYELTYIGNRPVEEGRKDAYDIVVTEGEKIRTMAPTMFYSEFNAGMMKKPAIMNFWSHDLYIAPGGLIRERVVDRMKSYVTLRKKTPQMASGLALTLDGFETNGMDRVGEGGDIEVFGLLKVGYEGKETEVLLKNVVTSDGTMQVVPVTHEPTGLTISMDQVQATTGTAVIGIAPPPIVLGKGESGSSSGIDILFEEFEVDMGGRGNKVSVYAKTTLKYGNETYLLKPGIISKVNMDNEYDEAAIGDTGLNLVLAEVNPDSRTASFYVAPAPEEMLWVEASVKPFILLLWIGTGLIVLGVFMAAIFRGRLAGRMAKRLGEGMNVVRRGDKAA